MNKISLMTFYCCIVYCPDFSSSLILYRRLAFEEVLENMKEECSSRTLMSSPNRTETLIDGQEMFAKGLHQV